MVLPLIAIGLTLLLMLISIAFDLKIKIKNCSFSAYWIIVLIGAILCIIFGFISPDGVKNCFISSSNINPLKILIIFISCTALSVILDEIGFFNYLANIALQKSKSSQTKIFFTFNFIIALLTIFTSNDILILTFTPFICYFTKKAKINPVPYIISEFVTANTWSMFLIIGNPTNIYLCSSLNISFANYFITMIIPTIVAGVTSLILVYLIFRKQLKEPIKISNEQFSKPNTTLLVIGLVGLFSSIFLMAISSYINLQLWYIPLIFAVFTYFAIFIACIIKKLDKSIILNAIKKLPFAIIPFLLSMSIIVESLNNVGFIKIIANFLDGKNIIIVGFIAFIFGNLVNNIPMSMLFASILSNFATTLGNVYAVVIASNICAFLTPVGALAGIMFMKILKNNNVNLSFAKFMFYGLIISVPTILLSLSSLLLF